MPQVNNISTNNIHSAGFNNSNSIQKYTGAVSSISDDLRINNEKCKSDIGTISGDIKLIAILQSTVMWIQSVAILL